MGVHINAEALRAALPLLEQEQVGTVVFRVSSAGGLVEEIQPLLEVVGEYNKKFRTAAWIETAAGPSAIVMLAVPEWYFMPAATYGPAPSGGMGVTREQRDLQQELGKQAAEATGRPLELVRAMQTGAQVSVDVDAAGSASWKEGDAGAIKLNEPKTNLYLGAADAEKVKLSKGTASTKEELASAMGITGVQWAGEAATKAVDASREAVVKADLDADTAYRAYLKSLGAAGRAAAKDRAGMVAEARAKLDALYKLAHEKPVVMKIYPFTKEWYDSQTVKLSDLEKKK